jgi:hypothetical protein
VDIVNDEDAYIPIWPKAEDFDHRDKNEVSSELGHLLEQRLQQLENRRLEGIFPFGID